MKFAWKRIEVVITALTRNQVTGNRPWVRIPPLPLKKSTKISNDIFVLFYVSKKRRKFKQSSSFVILKIHLHILCNHLKGACIPHH